jgi:hypothetical protein
MMHKGTASRDCDGDPTSMEDRKQNAAMLSRNQGAGRMENEAILEGAEVMDAEGERLGGVIAASPDYIVVEQGFFFPTDFYIPRTVIDKIEDAIVHLTITKQQALTAGWTLDRTHSDPAPETA